MNSTDLEILHDLGSPLYRVFTLKYYDEPTLSTMLYNLSGFTAKFYYKPSFNAAYVEVPNVATIPDPTIGGVNLLIPAATIAAWNLVNTLYKIVIVDTALDEWAFVKGKLLIRN